MLCKLGRDPKLGDTYTVPFFCVLSTEFTFWGNACPLHEETYRPSGRLQKICMARRYHDLWCLLSAGIREKALAQTALLRRVAEHRELFFRFSWVDYTTHKHGTFRITPPPEHLADWKSDYATMLGPIYSGETPSFEQILTLAADFEKTLNPTASS